MPSQPVIVAAKRTPLGRVMGGYSRTPSPQLGAYAIQAVLEEVPALRDHVDECRMGCVLQAGLGQNPARQAGLKAGLPTSLNAVTINKVCGSGLQAVMLAAQSIKAGDNGCVIAGGFENMTAAPHYAALRGGVKFGEATFQDHMQHDGLTCAIECWGMTEAADHIATKYEISREAQDRFSAQSHQRAAAAWGRVWVSWLTTGSIPAMCLISPTRVPARLTQATSSTAHPSFSCLRPGTAWTCSSTIIPLEPSYSLVAASGFPNRTKSIPSTKPTAIRFPKGTAAT